MKTPEPKPKKVNPITTSTLQSYAHMQTSTINSRRRVLEFEASEIEGSIFRLTSTLGVLRERQKKIAAMLVALEEVVSKRGC